MTDPSPTQTPQPQATADPLRDAFGRLRAEVGKAVVGQEGAVSGMIVGILAQGHVLLEGGPTLAGAFIEARCVDEVVAYLAPTLLGAGPHVLGDAGIGTLADAALLDVEWVSRLGTDVKIVARPRWADDTAPETTEDG